jgi:hypothetical protein
VLVFTRGDEVIWQKGGVIIGRLAHELLLERFFIPAVSPHEVVVIGFIHLEPGTFGGELGLQFVEQTFGQRIFEGDLMETEPLWIIALGDFAGQFVKKIS